MITGAGESKSTPDIVVSMMDLDPTMSNPKKCTYLAIADGEKQLNMAKVVRVAVLVFRIQLYVLTLQHSMQVITKAHLVSPLSSVVQRKRNNLIQSLAIEENVTRR